MPTPLSLPPQPTPATPLQVLCANIQGRRNAVLLLAQQSVTQTLNDISGYGKVAFWAGIGTGGVQLLTEFESWAAVLQAKAPDYITPLIANAVVGLTQNPDGSITVAS